MLNETSEWLHEARDRIGTAQNIRADVSSMNLTAVRALHTGVELAIKAPIVERHGGTLPSAFFTHELEALSRRTGIWSTLPSRLQNFVVGIDPFGPDTRYPRTLPYETLVNSSTLAEWDARLRSAVEFVDHIERNVIGRQAILGGLTV